MLANHVSPKGNDSGMPATFISKARANLVDSIKTAQDQPLEPELGSYPQGDLALWEFGGGGVERSCNGSSCFFSQDRRMVFSVSKVE